MSIILKTLVKSKINQNRVLAWADKRVSLEGQGHTLLDGVYPHAGMITSKRNLLNRELKNGLIELVVVTNLETIRPEDVVKIPKPVKTIKAVAPPAATKTVDPTKEKAKKQDRFSVGAIDEVGLPPAVSLPGAPDAPEMPKKIEIFKDGSQPIGEAAVEKVDIKKAAAAPKGTVAPDTEKAESINEKKEAAKKPRGRRSSKKKEEGPNKE